MVIWWRFCTLCWLIWFCRDSKCWYSNVINHPPFITIFMGGKSSSISWVVYGIAIPTLWWFQIFVWFSKWETSDPQQKRASCSDPRGKSEATRFYHPVDVNVLRTGKSIIFNGKISSFNGKITTFNGRITNFEWKHSLFRLDHVLYVKLSEGNIIGLFWLDPAHKELKSSVIWGLNMTKTWEYGGSHGSVGYVICVDS